jgi:hypothetical protein
MYLSKEAVKLAGAANLQEKSINVSNPRETTFRIAWNERMRPLPEGRACGSHRRRTRKLSRAIAL